jgi:hypothetical protein
VAEPIIYRDEVVALLFTVSDISETLFRIETLLKDDDAEEDDEG